MSTRAGCAPNPPVRAVVGRLACAVALIAAIGCQDPAGRVADRLRADIAAYAKDPSDAHRAEIEADFARMDAEIAALRADAAQKSGSAREPTERQIAALERTRDDLHGEFLRTEARLVGDATKKAVRSVGEEIGRGLEEAGKRMREAAGGKVSPPDTQPSDGGP